MDAADLASSLVGVVFPQPAGLAGGMIGRRA